MNTWKRMFLTAVSVAMSFVAVTAQPADAQAEAADGCCTWCIWCDVEYELCVWAGEDMGHEDPESVCLPGLNDCLC